ncbi:MAG: radical SAM protein [Victivallales bacterium]|nr:radical SAM protein [Victivallales bacterium]
MNRHGEISKRAFPATTDPACPACPGDFSWVDEYISRVSEYIFVREEDCLLIKRPNNVVKLNPSATAILKFLLNGGKIASVEKSLDGDANKLRELLCFFHTLKLHLENKLGNPAASPAVRMERFDMNFSSFPVLSEVAITYRCNLKCRFCYAGCNTLQTACRQNEMSTAEVKKVLHILFHDAKVPSVSFTGGEPLLREDLTKLIKYASGLGMRVNLISNGTLATPSIVREMASSGLASAQISIEACSSKKHDAITGRPGSFEKTISAFQMFREAGVLVHPNTTLCRANLDECTNFPKFVKNTLGCDRFSMNLVIPAGTAVANFAETWVSYSEIERHIQKIIEESRRHDIEFMWYSPLPMCIYNTVAHGLGNKGCGACDGLISVAPGGDVLPCSSFDTPVGNLLKQSFREVWDSPDAKMHRAKGLAMKECKSCENFHICNGACPLYWRHAGYGELEAVFKKNGTES